MSGEVVAAPIGLVALPIIVVGAVAFGAGAIIKSIIDSRLEAAAREREIEKARIQEWRDYQENEGCQMQAIQQQYEAMREIEQRLASISLTTPVENYSAGAPTAQGYYTLKPKTETVPFDVLQQFLHEIGSLLDSAPSEFRDAPDSPFVRLKQQQKLLIQKLESSRKLLREEIESFRLTVCQTITGNLKSCEQTQIRAKEAMHRLETLLDDILTTMHITNDPTIQNSLLKAKTQVMSLLNKQPVSLGQLEHLEKRVTEIKSDAANWLTNGAFRSTLANSLVRNLEEMGYRSFEPFPDDPHTTMMRAEMKIPGGERLRMTIDRKNQMSFRVFHEASSVTTKLSAEDKRLFRDQEKHWCKDLKELIRRLTQEGFTYTIGYEDLVMEIPVAVVEDVSEIISHQNDAEVKMLRRHYKKNKPSQRSIK